MMSEDEASIKEIADLIAKFRDEVFDRIRTDIEQELKDLEESEYDPARGRGRGPKWMDGA